MQALHPLFSRSSRLRPPAFIAAALAVYLAGAASQLLTTPDVISRAGFWPFAVIQVLLIWIWFAVHAARLRDADRPAGLAAGAAVLYALSIVLLLIVAVAFFGMSSLGTGGASTSGALGLVLLLSIVGSLAGSASYDFDWIIVAFFMALAFVPILIALAVTWWAATRPHVDRKV